MKQTTPLLEIMNMVCIPKNNIEKLELTLYNSSGSGNLYLRFGDNTQEGEASFHQGERNIVYPDPFICSYPIILQPEYVEINASSTTIGRALELTVPSWINWGCSLVSASVCQSPDYAVLLEIKNSPTTSKNGVYRRRELRKHPERISNWPEIVAYCEEQTVPIYDCRFH